MACPTTLKAKILLSLARAGMFLALFNVIEPTITFFSTTSEAQPPPDDAPYEPVFDYAVLRRRRRGVDLRTSLPEFKCAAEGSVDTGVQRD